MRAVRALASKDLRDLAREKSILAALLVQFFLAAFSTFLTVGLLGLYDPGSVEAFPSAQVAYDGPGGFLEHLHEARNLEVRRTGSEAALQDFRDGRLDAVVEETQDGEGKRTVTLLLAEGSIQSTLLLTQLQAMLADYEEELRRERAGRLEVPVLYVEPPEQPPRVPYAFAYATLLPLLFFTPVFLSGAIAADSFVQEVQQRTLVLLRSAPVTPWHILAGKLVVPLLLAPAQFLLWAGLLALNGIPVANLPGLLVLSVVATLLLACLGTWLALAFRRDGPVQASYAAAAILLALLSLSLPSDPFNVVARFATGTLAPPVLWTIVAWMGAALAAALVGLPASVRMLRRQA